MMNAVEHTETRVSRSRARRWLLVACGVASVFAAALGVVLPGLPTTIFLIIASWCFTRSCPWLEERLLRNRLFAPFLPYLDPQAEMPRRARIAATLFMWTAIVVSSVLLSSFTAAGLLAAIGAVGTGVIWRIRRGDPTPGRAVSNAPGTAARRRTAS